MKSPSRWCSLGSLGWMRGGYLARRPPAPQFSQGAVRALQAGDVGHAEAIRWDSLNWLEAEPFPEKYAVSDGDVLMPLRANPPRAIVARGVPDRVVVVGHWALITPDPTRVDPGFLVGYLNHPATRARLQGLMRGTNLQFLSLVTLRDFEVELPPLDLQRRIARVHALAEHMTELERQLAAARKQLIHSVTHAALQRAVQRQADK